MLPFIEGKPATTPTTTTTTTTTSFCLEGWVEQFGKCYKYFSEEKTWQDAEDHCQSNEVK